MKLSEGDAKSVLAHGGGLRIRSSQYLSPVLEVLAAYARQNNATLIVVVDSVLGIPDMHRIAAHGGGKVIFDVISS